MFKKATLTILAATLIVAVASNAMADTRWQRHHPRREQVNNRLARQNARIRTERKEGEINGAQARALHANVRAIRAQERADASTRHGHITRAQKRALNKELNANSRAIGR